MNATSIPNDWSSTRIIDVAEQIMDYRGRTPKKLGMDWGGGSIPAISARNVRMGWIDFTQDFYFGSDALYRQWMTHGDMEKGDILVTTEAPLGNVAVVPDDRRYILSQRTVLIRPHPTAFDKTYLLKFLQAPAFQRLLSENATGSTALGIQRKRLEQLVVVAPPLAEQCRIGETLQDTDGLIATLERMTTKKQAIKQGMMQQLLSCRIRLPGFTGPWSTTTLGSVGAFLKGRGVTRDDVRLAGVPSIRYGELYTAFNDYTSGVRSFVEPEIAATALPLRSGDLVFAGSGETREEIGKCVAYLGKTPAVAGGDIVVLRGSSELFNPIYLALLANAPDVVDQKSRAGQGDAVVHINSRALAAVEVRVPERPEQDAIANVLTTIESEIAALRDRLVKAKAVKEGMMQELLTGRTRLPIAEGAE